MVKGNIFHVHASQLGNQMRVYIRSDTHPGNIAAFDISADDFALLVEALDPSCTSVTVTHEEPPAPVDLDYTDMRNLG